jgi:hypothetical protein
VCHTRLNSVSRRSRVCDSTIMKYCRYWMGWHFFLGRRHLYYTAVGWFTCAQILSPLTGVKVSYGVGSKSLWDGIHKSTISLRFLGIILRFLRLEVSTFGFAFLEQSWVFFIDWWFCMDFWNYRGWYGFLSGFPPFDAFIIVVFMGNRCVYVK